MLIASYEQPDNGLLKAETCSCHGCNSFSSLNEGITMCLEIKYYNISVRQHNLIIYL